MSSATRRSARQRSRSVRELLERARDGREIVRIHRSAIETYHFDAFVLSMGRVWLLLQPVRDRIDLDGYDVIRVRDISKVALSPRKAFYDFVLAARKQKPRPVSLALDSTSELLRSVSRRRGLAVIHRELVDPSVCEIGRVSVTSTRDYSLLPVDLEGRVEPREKYPLNDVTRVQLDGGYERALYLASKAHAARAWPVTA